MSFTASSISNSSRTLRPKRAKERARERASVAGGLPFYIICFSALAVCPTWDPRREFIILYTRAGICVVIIPYKLYRSCSPLFSSRACKFAEVFFFINFFIPILSDRATGWPTATTFIIMYSRRRQYRQPKTPIISVYRIRDTHARTHAQLVSAGIFFCVLFRFFSAPGLP